jgi:hypothetical protein
VPIYPSVLDNEPHLTRLYWLGQNQATREDRTSVMGWPMVATLGAEQRREMYIFGPLLPFFSTHTLAAVSALRVPGATPVYRRMYVH